LAQYSAHLKTIQDFLRGNISSLLKNTQSTMLKMAKAKKFETAIRLRDQLKALTQLTEKQHMILPKLVSWDLVALTHQHHLWCVNLFKIRQGKMLGKENFIYKTPDSDIQIHSESTDNYGSQIAQTFLETY
jgi:excinuclease ABC subunit C